MAPASPFQYTPCYCEENIWHLAQQEIFHGHKAFVALISGKGPYRSFWFQRNAESPDLPVYWDYHVILLAHQNDWQVWDLDTTLGLPVAASIYFPETFMHTEIEPVQNDVVFRLIDAGDYIQNFSSDRAHMRLGTDDWAAPPPPWPVILQGDKSNLLEWLDIGNAMPGQLVTLVELMEDFLINS